MESFLQNPDRVSSTLSFFSFLADSQVSKNMENMGLTNRTLPVPFFPSFAYSDIPFHFISSLQTSEKWRVSAHFPDSMVEEGHLHWLGLFSVHYIVSSDVHHLWHQEVENGFLTNVILKDNIKENLFMWLPSK